MLRQIRKNMKAYVLNGIDQLDYMEVPKPILKSGEVLVEVKAAGICGSDIPRIFENGTYHFPTIPGHEFSGIVHEVYDERCADLIGKRVGVFPLIPCMKCTPCKEKKYEMCMQYDYLGSRRDGGFAEYVAVPIANLVLIPDTMSFQAAAMLEPTCVTLHALRRISVEKLRTVTIFGPGTIGLLIAQWLKTFGVEKVFLVGTNKGQKKLAEKLGINLFYNINECDAVQDILRATDNEGTDLVVECTGVPEVVNDCLELAKRGGNVIVVGNPHSDILLPRENYWKVLRKQLCLLGTWNSSHIPGDSNDDWKMAIDAIINGQIRPEIQITHELGFEDLKSGLKIMREKSEYFNKIMVVK